MKAIPAILLAAALSSVLLAATPTANAAVACAHLSGGPGLVGRTIEYVGNVEYAACTETVAYAYYLCVLTFGPTFCATIIA